MLMRSARVVQVLQDLLHSCMVDVIGFCCNLQPVASCIVVVIGVLMVIIFSHTKTGRSKPPKYVKKM